MHFGGNPVLSMTGTELGASQVFNLCFEIPAAHSTRAPGKNSPENKPDRSKAGYDPLY